jgi:hypothetical protein
MKKKKLNLKKAMQEAIRKQDLKSIVKYKFDFDLVPGQVYIIKTILSYFFKEINKGVFYRRISISAMTRYGKTQCVAIAIALIISFGIKVKIAFIGPKEEQAGILRQYMTELIMKDPELTRMAHLVSTGEGRIVKEASRKRMTFNTGAQYRVFSAEGDANRLMGFGADIVIPDEACLISRKAYVKMMRMMGDNPEECLFIELFNPWDRDNKAFEHTLDPNFKIIRIDYEQAIREGRTTEAFVEEQRKELTPLEFTVLYESKFPEESEDSLFNLNKINIAENKEFNFELELRHLEKIISNPSKYSESEVTKAKTEIKRYTRIISCDPADKGLDESVMYWGTKKDNQFELLGYFSEPKTESMSLVGRVFNKIKTFIGKRVIGRVNLDRIGIGAGPLSRLKELIRQHGFNNVKIMGCHFGETAIKPDHFKNKKAENYFRLRDLFSEGMISIPKIHKLRTQLVAMKWDLTSSAKKIIIDPKDYSPDWADALNYFVWKDARDLKYVFV